MEDTALSLRVLMGLYGRMRLTHGGVRKKPECVREPTQILPSSGTLRVGMYSKHEDKRDLMNCVQAESCNGQGRLPGGGGMSAGPWKKEE